MELEAIRKFVQDHPDGVVIRMIDGATFDIPHRDYISFGPPRELSGGKRVVTGTSFLVFEGGGVESMRLLNALLVAEVTPLKSNGNGSHSKRKSRKGR